MADLSEEATEKILSFMTTPNLLVPLLLELIMNGHVRDLAKSELQKLLEKSLFELQPFRAKQTGEVDLNMSGGHSSYVGTLREGRVRVRVTREG